jgi:hypothetical protein
LLSSIHKFQVFKHYKGKDYLFLGKCKHTETQEDMVAYQSLYGDYQVWVRPADMFYGIVEIDGENVQRFAPIVNL